MSEPPRTHSVWDRQVDRYGEARKADPSYAAQEHRVLALVLADRRRILEIGCGGGWMLEKLEAGPGRWICGSDLSPEMVLSARRRLRSDSGDGMPSLVASDCQALPFADQSFDCIVAMGVLEYVPDLAAAGAELRRVLCPGGLAVITVPNARAPYKIVRSASVDSYRGLTGLAHRMAGREQKEGDHPRREGLSFWAGIMADAGFEVSAELCAPQVVPFPVDEALPALGAYGMRLGKRMMRHWPALGTVCLLNCRRRP